MTYRSYQHFSYYLFITDVQNRISQVTSENNDLEFDQFKAALNEAIQRRVSINQRYVLANQAPFINKTINKKNLKKSRLRNKFSNTKSDFDRKAYNRQRNLCENLIILKILIHVYISTRDITYNKIFCKTVKPLFTDRYKQNVSGEG